jgi:hypothetical protein
LEPIPQVIKTGAICEIENEKDSFAGSKIWGGNAVIGFLAGSIPELDAVGCAVQLNGLAHQLGADCGDGFRGSVGVFPTVHEKGFSGLVIAREDDFESVSLSVHRPIGDQRKSFKKQMNVYRKSDV